MKNIYCYCICLVLLLFLFSLFVCIQKKETYTQEYTQIPKIIHQTAPADQSLWPETWFKCQKSWKEKFPDFEYKLWTDEDNYNLVKNDFPWFLETYENYDRNILKVDMIRYCILYKFGGIYADMDYMCMKNFFNQLPKNKVSFSESPYKENEFIMNALMCSPKNHPFWIKVLIEGKKRWSKMMTKNSVSLSKLDKVLYLTGPKLVTDMYYRYKSDVHVLPLDLYNPEKTTAGFNNPNVFTKHYVTSVWAKQ
jgi:mannosyltransferase OCH1-like enzyme